MGDEIRLERSHSANQRPGGAFFQAHETQAQRTHQSTEVIGTSRERAVMP